eukprot:3442118-Rhodomonas_salina.1
MPAVRCPGILGEETLRKRCGGETRNTVRRVESCSEAVGEMPPSRPFRPEVAGSHGHVTRGVACSQDRMASKCEEEASRRSPSSGATFYAPVEAEASTSFGLQLGYCRQFKRPPAHASVFAVITFCMLLGQ